MIIRSQAKSNRLNLLVTILFSIILLLFTNFYPNTLQSIGVISATSYIMFLTSWFNHNKVKINYYSIFLVFTYFFYFGQFFLLLFNIPMESGRTILDGLVPTQMLIKTGELIINSMIVLHFGVLVSSQNNNRYFRNSILGSNEIEIPINYGDSFKTISYILFFVSIIPSIIILSENLVVTLTQGYGVIFQSDRYTTGGFDNILRFISLITIPSFLMMLVTFKESKKIKYINFIIMVYLVLKFMTGSRMDGVFMLSVFLLIRHYWYKPIKYKESIILVVLSIFGLVLLSAISEVRNVLHISRDLKYSLSETFMNIVVRNPIFTIMEEAG